MRWRHGRQRADGARGGTPPKVATGPREVELVAHEPAAPGADVVVAAAQLEKFKQRLVREHKFKDYRYSALRTMSQEIERWARVGNEN